jgi:hypothetical protein
MSIWFVVTILPLFEKLKNPSKRGCGKVSLILFYFVDPINCFILLSIFGSKTPLVHDKRDFWALDLCPVLCDIPAFPRFSDPLPLTRKRLHTLLLALKDRLIPMNRVNNSPCGDWILVIMGCRTDWAKKRNMENDNYEDDEDDEDDARFLKEWNWFAMEKMNEECESRSVGGCTYQLTPTFTMMDRWVDLLR